MRPDIDYLRDTDFDYQCPKYVIDVMEECWAELPEHRYKLVSRLNFLSSNLKGNLFIIKLSFKLNLFSDPILYKFETA